MGWAGLGWTLGLGLAGLGGLGLAVADLGWAGGWGLGVGLGLGVGGLGGECWGWLRGWASCFLK